MEHIEADDGRAKGLVWKCTHEAKGIGGSGGSRYEGVISNSF